MEVNFCSTYLKLRNKFSYNDKCENTVVVLEELLDYPMTKLFQYPRKHQNIGHNKEEREQKSIWIISHVDSSLDFAIDKGVNYGCGSIAHALR